MTYRSRNRRRGRRSAAEPIVPILRPVGIALVVWFVLFDLGHRLMFGVDRYPMGPSAPDRREWTHQLQVTASAYHLWLTIIHVLFAAALVVEGWYVARGPRLMRRRNLAVLVALLGCVVAMQVCVERMTDYLALRLR